MTSTSRLVALALALTLFPAPVRAGGVPRAWADYRVPDVVLLDQDGERVRLKTLLPAGDKPVFVQFVFTSCTTICSILGAVFANFQKALGPDAKDVRFLSVSIDPDHDTPARLKRFLARFDAGPNWTFVTGDRADIKLVAKAFDAWVEDKMSHAPLTFMWSPAQQRWVRLTGFMGPAEMAEVYKEALER
jgi:protein SCO1/2